MKVTHSAVDDAVGDAVDDAYLDLFQLCLFLFGFFCSCKITFWQISCRIGANLPDIGVPCVETLNCLRFFLCHLCSILDSSRKSDASLSNHDPRTAVQLRTALKRLKEIMEGKSQVCTSMLTGPFVPHSYLGDSSMAYLVVAVIDKIELL